MDELTKKATITLDYLKERRMLPDAIMDSPEISNVESAEQANHFMKVSNSMPIAEIARSTSEQKDEELPYAIMRYFISKVDVIVVREKFYVHSESTYVPTSSADIGRMITGICRDRLKGKSSSFIEGIVNYLLKEPDIYVRESDIPKHLVAFQNCILDIQNRSVLTHSPRYFTLYKVNANYMQSATAYTPVFDAFLESITGGDRDLTERIWQMIGYTLTPDTHAKCFFLLQGVGNSGKSVLANLIQKLFSENAVMQLDIRSFSDKFATSNLVGKAVCSSPDLPSAPLDERTVSKLKQLTGNDPMSSDVKFSDHVKFVCNAKLIFSTNHAILTKSKDDAFFYRICTIPFRYTIARDRQDFDLENKIFKERDGIVTKAIAAYFRLVDNSYIFAGNYNANETISTDISSDIDYRISLYEFVKNRFRPNEHGTVFIEDAYKAFCAMLGGISISEFSSNFQRFAGEIHGAKKKRKRRFSTANPISCMKGISFIEGCCGDAP